MLRHGLSAPGMYSLVRQKTLKIPDDRLNRPQTIPLVDATMSAAAMFALKYPSMLQFEEAAYLPAIRHNLGSLFQVNQVPSDTAMREILDPIETSTPRRKSWCVLLGLLDYAVVASPSDRALLARRRSA